jgi:hypothetical protein
MSTEQSDNPPASAPTPRTEANIIEVAERDRGVLRIPEMVTADFARQLERENAALARNLRDIFEAYHGSGIKTKHYDPEAIRAVLDAHATQKAGGA